MNAPARHPARPGRAVGDPPIRLMIVDDSSVARAVLSRMLAVHADLEVVALASSAGQALDSLRSVPVDIVLLDVEMPGGSGLEALPAIVEAGRGARVLIVSSMCERDAEVAVRALASGAADTLPKPGTGNFGGRFSDILAEKLRRIGRAGRASLERGGPADDLVRLRAMPEGPVGCIAIGASTGGIHAINALLVALPKRIGAPILVTQHLPPVFMPFFARQIEARSGRSAAVAADGEKLLPGHIHIAPGDAHLCVEGEPSEARIRLDRGRAPSGCLPSADPMLASVADTYGAAAIGVILSGMGRDGTQGAAALADQGGALLAQDRPSSAVWGMPKAVAQAGLACAVLPPAGLARRIAARAEAGGWS